MPGEPVPAGQQNEVRVDIGEGLQMAALAWGDPASASRVLCVHGWMDNAGSFGSGACAAHHADEAAAADGLGSRLARGLGAFVVACDLLGHGRSSHQPGGLYSNSGWMMQLLKFTDQLGWGDRPFALVGHSMGQEICTMLAAAFPERVNAVVMLDGIGPWVSDEAWARRAVDQPAAALRNNAKMWLRRDRYHGSPRTFSSFEQVLGARLQQKFSFAGISRHAAAAITRRGTREDIDMSSGDVSCVYTHDPRVQMPAPMPAGYTEKQACQLISKLPRTLAVMAAAGIGAGGSGGESEGGDESDTAVRRFLINRTPHFKHQLEVAWVPGGHHVHLDKPEPVASHVVSFLRRVLADSSDQTTQLCRAKL